MEMHEQTLISPDGSMPLALDRRGPARRGAPQLSSSDRVSPASPIAEFPRRIPYDPEDRGAELHATFELGILLRGSTRRDHGKGWFRVGRGQAWLVPPMQPHRWQIPRRGYSRIVFHILPSFLKRIPAFGLYDLMFPFLSSARFGPVGRDPRFRLRLADLADELFARRSTDGEVPHGQAMLDFLRVMPLVAEQVMETVDPDERRMRPDQSASSIVNALELAERSLDRAVPLADAARACGMGRTRFCHAFMTSFGMSFSRYHLQARLADAAHHLRHGSEPIKHIAAQHGFTDASHFHHQFVRQYGLTPAHYRN